MSVPQLACRGALGLKRFMRQNMRKPADTKTMCRNLCEKVHLSELSGGWHVLAVKYS